MNHGQIMYENRTLKKPAQKPTPNLCSKLASEDSGLSSNYQQPHFDLRSSSSMSFTSED